MTETDLATMSLDELLALQAQAKKAMLEKASAHSAQLQQQIRELETTEDGFDCDLAATRFEIDRLRQVRDSLEESRAENRAEIKKLKLQLSQIDPKTYDEKFRVRRVRDKNTTSGYATVVSPA